MTDIYSNFSNIHRFNYPEKPSITFNSLEFNGTLDGIIFNVLTYQNPQSIVEYQEVWYSYGESPIGLFENYPFRLLYKNYTLDGEFNIPFNIPPAEFDGNGDMLNEYLYIKIGAYSPIARSRLSDVQAVILPPNACTNLQYTLSQQYDNYVDLTWTRNSGRDTKYYVYLKKGEGEYQSKHLFSNGETEFSLFLDNEPSGLYYVKIVAENDSGTVDSDEITIEDFEISAVPTNFALDSYVPNSTWTFSWEFPESLEATSFKLYRKVDSGSWSLVKTIKDGEARSTVYSSYSSSGTYYFKLSSVVGGEESDFSDVVEKVLTRYDMNLSGGFISPFTDTSLDEGQWRLNMSISYYYSNYSSYIEIEKQMYGEDWTPLAQVPVVPGTTSYNYVFSVPANRRVEHIRARLVNNSSQSDWDNRDYDYARAGVVSAPTFVSANWDSTSPSRVILKWQFLVNYPYSTGIWLKPNPGDNWIKYVSEVVKCDDSGLATARLPWGSDNAYAGATYSGGNTNLNFHITIS